jgi:inosose dehydratase/3D-(3,5/4)-trihydroxycyclohexane-1,2-dione acylhydrolase (decyclizing)
MTVRLGTNPIAWSNDDLRELGGATPLETCLSEAASAGYSGIELGHKFPRQAAVLRPILDRHGLALVSGWYSSALLERDAEAEMIALRPHLELLRGCGCEVLILAETSNAIHGDRTIPLSRRPVLTDSAWDVFAPRLSGLAERVRSEGMTIAYHHHMGTVIQSEAEIDRLMASTADSLTLLLDTGHATFAGADPVGLARRYRGRISHVHCKDVRSAVMANVADRDASFLDSVVDGVFTVPGDGGIDFAGVLAALPGYHGWLVVEAEQDPAKAHPLTYARIGHENLSRHAARSGLL